MQRMLGSLAIFSLFTAAALDVAKDFPTMKMLIDLAENSPEEVLGHIKKSPLQAKVPEVAMPQQSSASATLPTVAGHGMGDSCWEPGFASVTRAIAKRTGTYAKCIPTGSNIISDTINGFLMNMDKSVDVFAEKIRADPQLKGGFNAIGFSQGNSLIRGYIQKYNDPPVRAFISVHGTVMGVAALPSCFENGKPLGVLCKAVAEVLGDLAYNGLSQHILFQAGYYRAADKTTSQAYLKHSQIAQWNNENKATANATYKTNFASVEKFAMVKAMRDTMVFPNAGEHWGSFPDGHYSAMPSPMNETKFYEQDLFGLKEVDAAGKIFYETTPGGHMQFSEAQLVSWVDKYFLRKAADVIV
jgi:palmitoyl-protein thioesterase